MNYREYETFNLPEEFEQYMDLLDSEGLDDVLPWKEAFNSKDARFPRMQIIQFSENLLRFLDYVLLEDDNFFAKDTEPELVADELEAERELWNETDFSTDS